MLAKHVDFISGLHLRSRFTLRGRAGSTGSAPAPRTGEGNVTEVQVVEARDRGFQLHVRVLVEHERYKQLCAGQSGVSCAIRHFKSLCTPVRAGGTEYLKPVEIQGQIQEDACSLDSAGPRLQISCVVVLGPSLDLVNFSPTQLQLQTVLSCLTEQLTTQFFTYRQCVTTMVPILWSFMDTGSAHVRLSQKPDHLPWLMGAREMARGFAWWLGVAPVALLAGFRISFYLRRRWNCGRCDFWLNVPPLLAVVVVVAIMVQLEQLCFGAFRAKSEFLVNMLVFAAVVFADGSASAWASYARLAFPSLSMTVSDLRRMYKVPDGHRNHAPKNSQALASFFNISASEADARRFHLAMGNRRQPSVHFVGPQGPPGFRKGQDAVGSLHLKQLAGEAMGNNVPVTYWATPGGDPATAHEPFLEWILELANRDLAKNRSRDYSAAYQRRANLELAKLGLRGVTVLAASGDTGVQGAAQAGGQPPRCAPFAAVWPASSPYVTAVGATMVSNHMSEVCNIDRIYAMGSNSSMPFACPETNVGEIVCSTQTGSMITSGGGFSQRFARPDYQAEVIEEYLSQVKVNRSLFNATGRGYPDLSATGANVPIIFENRLTMVGGTSASSPIVAGLVALLNGERLASGLPPLGFLNPLLYSSYQRWPDIVQDVRVGNISGSNLLLPSGSIRDCAEGFEALPGWDAATGLGSPNFKEMLQRLVA
eukprot:g28962.t2